MASDASAVIEHTKRWGHLRAGWVAVRGPSLEASTEFTGSGCGEQGPHCLQWVLQQRRGMPAVCLGSSGGNACLHGCVCWAP